jgi:hypothetical protein
MSFRLSFRQALLGPTRAHSLDDPPDLSSKDDTRAHGSDGGVATHNRSVAGSRRSICPQACFDPPARPAPLRYG